MKKTALNTLRRCVSARGIFILIMMLVLIALSLNQAMAANYTASWNPVDFAVVNSDLTRSGYRIYESTDNGETKHLMAEIPSGTTTHPFSRDSMDGVCLYATAYNQWGESRFSAPYCTQCPDVPVGLKVMLQEIIGALQKFIDTL